MQMQVQALWALSAVTQCSDCHSAACDGSMAPSKAGVSGMPPFM